MTPSPDARPRILLVDDEPLNLEVLQILLQDDYRLLYARDGERALALARTERPDLVLLDVMMPNMNGYDVCHALKADSRTWRIPVIFVTALSDTRNEALGFEAGAVDYITKPVSPAVVRMRVRNHLSLVNVQELRETRLQVVQRLGRAAEYKDNETGLHVIRMSHYARCLALRAGCSQADADDLLHAAPMHDVGKIGIPDAILQKKGRLDADEWVVMKRHTEIGAHIIGEHDDGLLGMARRIAIAHHEKWDGSGYPYGLAGTDIPLEARLVALADVFDALTSERPYKAAWPVSEAVDWIRQERGRHFDPDLTDVFLQCVPELLAIRARWVEPTAA